MKIKNIIFRFRYWLMPVKSKQIDKRIFAVWLNTLKSSYEFDNSFNKDPISQFLHCTTGSMNVTVGLDWYSFEKYTGKPLTECYPLPSWGSSVMWDKEIKSPFTKEKLLKRHPNLILF